MNVHKILTKSNQNMAFVNLEDETGLTEVIIFPRTWSEKEKLILPGQALTVEGKISRKDNRKSQTEDIKILMDTCHVISDSAPTSHQPSRNPVRVILSIPENSDRGLLQKIKDYLEQSPGSIPVTLLLPTTEGQQPMPLSHRVESGERLHSQLAHLLGPERVVWE